MQNSLPLKPMPRAIQQHEIAKSNTQDLKENDPAGQTAVHALFDRHARTMLQFTPMSRGNRHEHLLNAMSLQHGEIATTRSDA